MLSDLRVEKEEITMQKKVNTISPILNDRLAHSASKCTCSRRRYSDENECEYSLAISISRNEVTKSVSTNMPLGIKKCCRGWPF